VSAAGPPVLAVVFDVGETLVDETRPWGEWADWLGIPRLTVFSVLGAVIARGEDHRRVFEILRPGLDVAAERARMRAAYAKGWMHADDLYPDAVPALRSLRAAGYRLGVAGNQPRATEDAFASLGLELDLIASSDGLGVAKPDPRFFGRIADLLGLPPASIAYVGDRLDNDVGPASRFGMRAIRVRRGPWGFIEEGGGQESAVIETISSLAELPSLLGPGRAPVDR
jgi:HAD superfamily hydrolase (TIGR01549 family)